MKKHLKRMNQPLYILRTFKVEMYKTKNGMPLGIHSDISLHWMGNHNNLSQPCATFFYLLQEQYIMTVKAYLLKIIPTESNQRSSLKTFKESIKLQQPLHSVQAV